MKGIILAGGSGNLCLCKTHALSNRQKFIPNSVKIKYRHLTFSNQFYTGVILPIFVDKQEV